MTNEEAARELQVAAQISNLASQVERLQGNIEKLEARLHRVAHPEDECCEDRVSSDELVPLAHDIKMLADKVSDAASTINSIMRRLEV